MECPVCLEPYDLQRRRPKVLWPCGHSVCLNCLQDPGFRRQCPLDRKPVQGEPVQLPDNMVAVNLIAQGDGQKRSAFWCRDCETDFTEDCSDAGHRSCSQRQLRAERLQARVQPMVQPLQQGVAASALLKQHANVVSQDAQRQMLSYQAIERQLQEALAKLQGTPKGDRGLQQALDAAEQLGPRAKQMKDSASLAGLRGRCSVVVQAQDGAEWRASVALEDYDGQRALRHALLDLRSTGCLQKVNGTAAASEDADAISMQSRALDLANRPPNEMSVNEMKEFLRKDNLKEVRSLKGVNCSLGPRFCELLLQAVSPRLEELEILNPQKQHMKILSTMPTLTELCISPAQPEHMLLVKNLKALRKLDVVFCNSRKDFPELPLHLEELTLNSCTDGHMLSIQKMHRLRRLRLWDLPRLNDKLTFTFSTPLSPLGGLTWLSVVSPWQVPILLPLIQAHSLTLHEIQLYLGSNAGWQNNHYISGLPDFLRECVFPNLKRLVLVRHNDRRYVWSSPEPSHSESSCRCQVRELQDALLRRDASDAVRSVAVLCDICDKGLQL